MSAAYRSNSQHSTDSASSSSKYSEHINTKITKKGGSPQASSLQDWTNSLENKDNWAIIDRGCKSSQDLLGIWHVIHKHCEFVDKGELAIRFRTSWERMSGIRESVLDVSQTPEVLRMLGDISNMKEVVKDMDRWL